MQECWGRCTSTWHPFTGDIQAAVSKRLVVHEEGKVKPSLHSPPTPQLQPGKQHETQIRGHPTLPFPRVSPNDLQAEN